MGCLKERLADVRQTRKFGNRHFWAEGYYVSTMGLNEATIRKYIEDQEKHDIALDKFSVGSTTLSRAAVI